MTIADSNVLLDVIGRNPEWSGWSAARLTEAVSLTSCVIINPVIYAEIAPTFASSDEVNNFLSQSWITLSELTKEALFKAGRAHAANRANRGKRERVLADS